MNPLLRKGCLSWNLLESLFGLGHCAVIVLAGTFTEVLQRYLDWNGRSRGTVVLKKVCGILVIAGGAWMIYSAP
jgi:cytochrome c-type biogenesis protein